MTLPRYAGAMPLLFAAAIAAAAPVPKEDAEATVRRYMTRYENGEGGSEPILALPSADAIPELNRSLVAGTERQKGSASRLISLLGRRERDAGVRRSAVLALLRFSAKDEVYSLRHNALDDLLAFGKADFSKEGIAILEKVAVTADAPPGARMLAGICDLRALIDPLKKHVAEHPPDERRSPFGDPWSAHLALARLGDADSVKHCVATVEGERDLAQRCRHFEELAYTRRPEAFDALVRHLMSDERLGGVKERDPGTKVAKPALHFLTKGVEGFPIATDKWGDYTDEQIAAARKWVKEQKALTIKP